MDKCVKMDDMTAAKSEADRPLVASCSVGQTLLHVSRWDMEQKINQSSCLINV